MPAKNFFVQGHDSKAKDSVIKAMYGTTADFLAAHGYGPGGKSAVKGGDDA